MSLAQSSGALRVAHRVAAYPRLRYLGSKYKLVPHLADVFSELGGTTALDAFSGSGVVSYTLKWGFQVTSNDFLAFPQVIANAAVVNQRVMLSIEDRCGIDRQVRLNEVLYDASTRWDVVIVDTPGRQTGIVGVALAAATGVLVPAIPEGGTVAELTCVLRGVEAARERLGQFEIYGIVRVGGNSRYRQLAKEQTKLIAQSFGAPVFRNKVPEDARFGESHWPGSRSAPTRRRRGRRSPSATSRRSRGSARLASERRGKLMAAGRLSPAEFRARLQSGLAGEARRGASSTAGPMQDRAHNAEVPAVDAPVQTIGCGRPRPPAMPDPAVRAVRTFRRPQLTVSRVEVLHRHDSAAVLRGYRIPVTLHRRAERAKLAASAQRRELVAWDEGLQIAIDALPAASVIASGLEAQRARSGSEALAHAGPTRVLQGAVRRDQEMLLRTLRLDLDELLDRRVQLEEVWTWMVARFSE